MQEITSRGEVRLLVGTFYEKIRADELLGPIFNRRIPAENWPAHLERLTDFWEANLLGSARFRGNPSQKHLRLDADLGHTIAAAHFERWLQLWSATVDALFTGERAERAKTAAQLMGAAQLGVILRHRPAPAPPPRPDV